MADTDLENEDVLSLIDRIVRVRRCNLEISYIPESAKFQITVATNFEAEPWKIYGITTENIKPVLIKVIKKLSAFASASIMSCFP